MSDLGTVHLACPACGGELLFDLKLSAPARQEDGTVVANVTAFARQSSVDAHLAHLS